MGALIFMDPQEIFSTREAEEEDASVAIVLSALHAIFTDFRVPFLLLPEAPDLSNGMQPHHR